MVVDRPVPPCWSGVGGRGEHCTRSVRVPPGVARHDDAPVERVPPKTMAVVDHCERHFHCDRHFQQRHCFAPSNYSHSHFPLNWLWIVMLLHSGFSPTSRTLAGRHNFALVSLLVPRPLRSVALVQTTFPQCDFPSTTSLLAFLHPPSLFDESLSPRKVFVLIP